MLNVSNANFTTGKRYVSIIVDEIYLYTHIRIIHICI